ncbi:MAG TPA: alpha/beta fold hydrolase [Verrucomicrobiae bacterium]|nr:alpha/beta fold hydrolase [Verrucomicrobiae bacterium]
MPGFEPRPFRPAWWCPGAHAQTIFARFFRPAPPLELTLERLETPDGDFLDIEILEGARDKPGVIVLHGLEGSSEAPYVRSLLSEIHKRGWHAAAVNFRGCSAVKRKGRRLFNDWGAEKNPNRLPTTYHSGKTDDLDWVVQHLLRKTAWENYYLAGYSIGGNIVLKWLGEQGASAAGQIKKAAAVSVPYDLVKSVELMDQGFNRRVYTRSLLSSLKAKSLEKEKDFPGLIDIAKVLKCTTFREFDEEVTARLNHFHSALHYWTESSSARYLDSIRVPTLLIHAADDPFFEGRYLPLKAIESNASLRLCLVSRGGHLGFVSGKWPWRQDLWLEGVILSYFDDRPDK